jgi:ubiquinone biosynthesis monooxygenase Coq7
MSLVDAIITELDRGLRTVFAADNLNADVGWLDAVADGKLDDEQKSHAAGLMRVNHVGEVCAQALYYGQSLVTADIDVKKFLLAAAEEETEHLFWCKTRLSELNNRVSYLNPLWYSASFMFGICAGLANKANSLGFIMATEKQVEQHLRKHLLLLPKNDFRSKAIVEKMIIDEVDHADHAEKLGGVTLHSGVQTIMRYIAKGMTNSAYWL